MIDLRGEIETLQSGEMRETILWIRVKVKNIGAKQDHEFFNMVHWSEDTSHLQGIPENNVEFESNYEVTADKSKRGIFYKMTDLLFKKQQSWGQ